MQKSVLLASVSGLAAAAIFGLADQARAQAAATVSDVVVTADRRETNIQKTPIAVSAISASALDKSFVNSITDLNALVPSLEITKTAGTESVVTIRGVGSETPENTLTTSPGVAFYIDGVYIANSITLNQTLFDLDRVEVLRGPQGDLYGESATGGAITLVTKQPQLHTLGAFGDASLGDYDLTRFRLGVNIPIGDDIAIRVSAQKYDHTGFGNDSYYSTGYDLDDAHDHSEKLSILWKPTDQFSATLTGMWYKSNTHGAEQKTLNDPAPSPRDVYQDYPNQFNIQTQLYHLNLQYDTSLFSVRSITGYQKLYNNNQQDGTQSAFSITKSYNDTVAWINDLDGYTEELDFLSAPGSKLEWVFGGFFLNQTAYALTESFSGTTDPSLNPSILVPKPDITTNPPTNLSYGNDTFDTRQGAAGFARLGYNITPQWRVSAGGRINYDRYSNDAFNYSGAFGININHQGRSFAASIATWKFESDYNVTPANMVYASLSRGYKPGGVNGVNTTAQVIQGSFLPETNDAFEIGSKNFFLDHTLQVNVAAYYYLYKNFQYIEDDPYPFDAGMTNIPTIHSYGAEFETAYNSLDGKLHLNGSLALEDGKIVGNYYSIDSSVENPIESKGPCAYGGAYYNPACWKAVEASALNLNGKTPPAMPNVSGSASAAYDIDLAWGKLTPRVQVIYRGQEWARIFNVPALDKVPAYTVTNLNLEFDPTGSKFRFSLAATNVGNVVGVNSRFTGPYGANLTSQEFIPPRQIIGTIAYAF
jgi:iron complex outermembrane receptor protein